MQTRPKDTLRGINSLRTKARLSAEPGWFAFMVFGLVVIIAGYMVVAGVPIDPLWVYAPGAAVATVLCWHRWRVSRRLGRPLPRGSWTIGLRVVLVALAVWQVGVLTGIWPLAVLGGPAVMSSHLAWIGRRHRDAFLVVVAALLFAFTAASLALGVEAWLAIVPMLYGVALLGVGARSALQIRARS